MTQSRGPMSAAAGRLTLAEYSAKIPVCVLCRHCVVSTYTAHYPGYGLLWWKKPSRWFTQTDRVCTAVRDVVTGNPKYAECIYERASDLGCGPSGRLFEPVEAPEAAE